MLYVDIPTLPELKALAATRADACVSIYLPTTPVTQDTAASRIELKNLTKVALGQLEAVRFDKRRLAVIGDQLAELADDDGFWKYQAMSLAVLVTPDAMRTFRLPNRLTAMAEVSDRFHLKPLLRAITFPHETFVLALSENAARLVEAFADLPAQEVKIRDLPKDGADALKRQANDKGSQRKAIGGRKGRRTCCASTPARSMLPCVQSSLAATRRSFLPRLNRWRRSSAPSTPIRGSWQRESPPARTG